MNATFTLPLQYTLLKVMNRSTMAVASAILYRFRLHQNTEKWFVMTNQQITELTGLSVDVIIRAKKRLVAMGFIETSRGYMCCYYRVTKKALEILEETCRDLKEKIQTATKAAAKKAAAALRASDQVRDLFVRFVVHTGKLPWRGCAQKWANTLAAAVRLSSPDAVLAEFSTHDRSPGDAMARLRSKIGDKSKGAKKKVKAAPTPEKYEYYFDEVSQGWVAVPIS